MEIVYFTIIGIGIYAAADWILDRIERARAARFADNRQVVFFAIFLALALPTFWVIQLLQGPG